MSDNKSLSDTTHFVKDKRQSRIDQFNKLSNAQSSVQRVRRPSYSSKEPAKNSEFVTDEFSKLNFAATPAATPGATPEDTPSVTRQASPSVENHNGDDDTPSVGLDRSDMINLNRDQSAISLSSMVRSEPLDTPGAPTPASNVPFPNIDSASPRNEILMHSKTHHKDQTSAPQRSASTLSFAKRPIKDSRNSHLQSSSSSSSFGASGGGEYQNDKMNSGNTDKSENSNLDSRRYRATTLDVPGLTRSKVSPDGRIARGDIGAKLVIVMVGLPARGKSYITKKLARYLNWQQHDCRIFNVGNTRRRASKHAGPSSAPLPGEITPRETKKNSTEHEGDFFSPDNPESVAQRERWAEETLEELLDFVVDGDGSVGILDATNTTLARRKRVMKIIDKRSNGQLKVLFLESICTQRYIIESNVRLKLSGPDYKHMDQEKAISDFLLRLKNYEKAYEPISEEEEANTKFQYVKFINVGQKFECGNIKGFLSGQAVFFLLNFNLRPRQIWITRHGESTDNQLGRIGGDAGLTERGKKYSAALSRFMRYQKLEFKKRLEKEMAEQMAILENNDSKPPTPQHEMEEQNFCVWASMLRRTVETASYFEESEFDLKEMRMLNELDPGICDGMTYQEIKEQYPNEYEARMLDKIRYRYPGIGGESYLDVINRLRPVIVEIERMEDNCLVICHRVVARILLSYFMNLGRDAIGNLEVPLHTLYVLEPKPYGVDWALYKYNERFDWFYKVSPEDAQVQSQLNDQKRRYTVVATAGMKLGEFTPSIKDAPPPEFTENAIDSSSENEEDNDDDAMKLNFPRSAGKTTLRSRKGSNMK